MKLLSEQQHNKPAVHTIQEKIIVGLKSKLELFKLLQE